MYLIKLLPEQIAEHWEMLRYAISESLPPIASETPEKMNNILRHLLMGGLQCWITSEKEVPEYIRAVVTTRFATDDITQTKTLLIYSLYSFAPLSEADTDAMYKPLTQYAKANGCNRVIAYAIDDNVVGIAEKYGMVPRYQLLTLDL